MATLTEIKLNKAERELSLSFENGKSYVLSAEYLRVYSPSAEVRGHGAGQEVLQLGKELVAITDVEPVGNYAVRLIYSDNHDTGIYSWEYLEELAENLDENWQDYLDRVKQAGQKRKTFVNAAL